MKKDEFVRKVEKHFDLIPKYFFNTFQKKIDSHFIDSQKSMIAKWFDSAFLKAPKSKNFEDFVLVDWIVDLLKAKEGLNFDSKAVKSVAFDYGYTKGTYYFKGIGTETGMFLKTNDAYVKQFFDAKRSMYKSKINQNG